MKPAYCTPGMSAGLLMIRLVMAVVFIYHGCQITFGLFGGPGPAGFASFSHMPLMIGYLVGIAQLAGGLSMLTGMLLPLGALAIAIVMGGAIFLVHLPKGFSITNGGYEYALTELVVAIGLALTGPGAYSLQALLSSSQPQSSSTTAR